MTVSSPEEFPVAFWKVQNLGDVEAVVSMYEPDATLAVDLERTGRGHDQIRSLVEGFLAGRPTFVLHDSEITRTDDIALVRSRWTLTTKEQDGSMSERSIEPVLVVRRQPEGNWLVVIARPLPLMIR